MSKKRPQSTESTSICARKNKDHMEGWTETDGILPRDISEFIRCDAGRGYWGCKAEGCMVTFEGCHLAATICLFRPGERSLSSSYAFPPEGTCTYVGNLAYDIVGRTSAGRCWKFGPPSDLCSRAHCSKWKTAEVKVCGEGARTAAKQLAIDIRRRNSSAVDGPSSWVPLALARGSWLGHTCRILRIHGLGVGGT